MHGHSQEGTKKKLFQNLFKLMFKKYNKKCKVGEGHFTSYFYKNQNSINCVMIVKVMCVLRKPKQEVTTSWQALNMNGPCVIYF
jgi:hypothetical protein